MCRVSEETVIKNCSPTMAGLKTGSLFACPAEDRRELNGVMVPRGVRLLPVRCRGGCALIYMYRPERLRNDLKDRTARDILRQKRYPAEDPDRCVNELIRRLNVGEEFPHEVGLFLGYPAEDVYGFIHQGARCAKCGGVWKVYGDEEGAKKKFALYRKCTRLYLEAYRRHNSIDRLIVSGS